MGWFGGFSHYFWKLPFFFLNPFFEGDLQVPFSQCWSFKPSLLEVLVPWLPPKKNQRPPPSCTSTSREKNTKKMTLPETNEYAPENQRLEDDSFPCEKLSLLGKNPLIFLVVRVTQPPFLPFNNRFLTFLQLASWVKHRKVGHEKPLENMRLHPKNWEIRKLHLNHPPPWLLGCKILIFKGCQILPVGLLVSFMVAWLVPWA